MPHNKVPPPIETDGRAALDLDAKTQEALLKFEDAILEKLPKSEAKDTVRFLAEKALTGEISADDITNLTKPQAIEAIIKYANVNDALIAAGATRPAPATQPAKNAAEAKKAAEDFIDLDPKESRALAKFAEAVETNAEIPDEKKKQLIAAADNQLQKGRITAEQLEALTNHQDKDGKPNGMTILEDNIKSNTNGGTFYFRNALDDAILKASGIPVGPPRNTQAEADNLLHAGDPHAVERGHRRGNGAGHKHEGVATQPANEPATRPVNEYVQRRAEMQTHRGQNLLDRDMQGALEQYSKAAGAIGGTKFSKEDIKNLMDELTIGKSDEEKVRESTIIKNDAYLMQNQKQAFGVLQERINTFNKAAAIYAAKHNDPMAAAEKTAAMADTETLNDHKTKLLAALAQENENLVRGLPSANASHGINEYFNPDSARNGATTRPTNKER